MNIKAYIITTIALIFSFNLNAQSAQALSALAYKSYKNNRYDDAITLALDALKKDRQNLRALWVCSVAYTAVEEYDQALLYKHKVVELRPQSAAYLTNLGGTYAALGLDSLAMIYLNRALESNSNYIHALVNKAGSEIYHFRMKEAFANLDRVIQLDPNLSEAYRTQAIAYEYLEDYEKALEYGIKYQKTKPNNPDVHMFNEGFKRKLNPNYKTPRSRLKKAEKALTASINQNRWSSDNLYARGKVYEQLGYEDLAKADYQKALEILNDILKKAPYAWPFRQLRGNVFLALGAEGEAYADYTIALRLNPNSKHLARKIDNLLKK